MLDRKTFIDKSNLYKNDIPFQYIIFLIKEYCLEKGREEYKINEFLQYINPFNYKSFFDTSFSYFADKFNITILKDKNNQIIKIF